MDLQKFRERLKEYRSRIGISQEELADAVFTNKSWLSEALNGKRPLTAELVHRIIYLLAEREAIRGQSQAHELLRLTDCEDFSPADWKAPPLVDLLPEPLPSTPSTQLFQHDTIPVDTSDETQAHPKYSEGEIDYNTLPTSEPTQQEEQTTARAEFPEEQTHLSSQDEDYSPMISIQPPEPRNPHLSQKDKLEAAYRQLITISEARFQFAGTVEALRKISGDVAHEALPHAKTSLDEAEQAFHESEVRHTLMLLDNNKVWAHYFMATEAFRKYKERTKDLVEEAMKPPSPLVRYVLRIDALLAGDRWRDDDPETGNEYQKMEKELNAMLKAMNKRLRLQFWAFRTRYG